PADSVLFAGIEDEHFYFVHSYAAKTDPADLGPSAVMTGNPYSRRSYEIFPRRAPQVGASHATFEDRKSV
ncbi:Imidazole glycerol phosphate synthase subunit HisH, partial [human gut metagenome]